MDDWMIPPVRKTSLKCADMVDWVIAPVRKINCNYLYNKFSLRTPQHPRRQGVQLCQEVKTAELQNWQPMPRLYLHLTIIIYDDSVTILIQVQSKYFR